MLRNQQLVWLSRANNRKTSQGPICIILVCNNSKESEWTLPPKHFASLQANPYPEHTYENIDNALLGIWKTINEFKNEQWIWIECESAGMLWQAYTLLVTS
jgi:hypothetical protein